MLLSRALITETEREKFPFKRDCRDDVDDKPDKQFPGWGWDDEILEIYSKITALGAFVYLYYLPEPE